MKASETLRAPAKLNLTLEVLGRREGGLHGVRSVMVPVDLCDEIVLEPAADFSFACDLGLPTGSNLAERAIRALPLSDPGVRVTLRKKIPSGAGMGGGSSDAAAILLAASRGTFGELPDLDFVKIARGLGSDVPFFLAETGALVEGTGERVTALGRMPPWHAIVVKPPASVSTAWAYEQIDRAPPPSRARSASAGLLLGAALQRADFSAVLELMHNDFHEPILAHFPEIAQAADLLNDAGCPKPMLTGSGACVFSLFDDAVQWNEAADRCGSLFPQDFEIYACTFLTGESWRGAA